MNFLNLRIHFKNVTLFISLNGNDYDLGSVKMEKTNKVVIIGAGPAGIGMAIALIEMGLDDILILDKGQVGESFKNWPLSTRFITPSFTTNGFGTPDINAITPHSSPAFTFKKEHISGKDYVQYLEALVQIYNLKVDQHTNVLDVSNNIDNETYKVYTDHGTIDAEYIFVATGNFSYPYKPFKHGRHYSEVEKFSDINGELAVVIGGNESGFDAALNLALSGKIVDIYTNSTSYKQEDADPSIRLSPYTHQRYEELKELGYPIRIHTEHVVKEIEYKNGQYVIQFNGVHDDVKISEEPILATGFNPVQHNRLTRILFENDGTNFMLTDDDESTINPNVFMIGDTVKHQDVILCYIYKFRTRLAVLAKLICDRESFEANEDAIEFYQSNQMFLDDYDCCDVNCSC